MNGTWKSGETAPILIENTWQHVAVTFKADGKSIGLWLGGKLVQEFTNEVPAVPMSNYWTRDVLFGKTSYDTAIDDGFQGDLGEVTLFADVLDPDQMTKIAK